MRLLLHQALKDLRLLRWLAFAWVLLVIVLQAFTLWAARVAVGDDSASVLLSTWIAIQASLVGLFGAIAVVLIQSDPGVSGTAFWFTRPISAATILGTKLLLAVVILVLVPVAADLVAMVLGGLPAARALPTVAPSIATQLAWLIPLLALAAVTSTLAQFVCAALGEVFLFFATNFVLGALFTRPAYLRSGFGEPSLGALLTALVVLLVGFGMGALVLAYRTRTRRAAGTVAAAAPVALALLAFAWPFGLVASRSNNPASTPGVAALPGGAWLGQDSSGERVLGATFRFSNVPARTTLSARAVRAWIDYPDGRTELSPAVTAIFPASTHAAGSEHSALSDAIGVPRLTETQSAPPTISGFYATLPETVYARHRNDTGTLHADIRVLMSEKRATLLPARPGARYYAGGLQGEITDVRAEPGALSIAIRQIAATTLAVEPGDIPSAVYAVRSQGLGVGTLPSESRAARGLPLFRPPLPAPAHLGASRLTFKFPWPDQVGSADFLRDAELVIVETRPAADAIVHLTMPIAMLSSLAHPQITPR